MLAWGDGVLAAAFEVNLPEQTDDLRVILRVTRQVERMRGINPRV